MYFSFKVVSKIPCFPKLRPFRLRLEDYDRRLGLEESREIILLISDNKHLREINKYVL